MKLFTLTLEFILFLVQYLIELFISTFEFTSCCRKWAILEEEERAKQEQEEERAIQEQEGGERAGVRSPVAEVYGHIKIAAHICTSCGRRCASLAGLCSHQRGQKCKREQARWEEEERAKQEEEDEERARVHFTVADGSGHICTSCDRRCANPADLRSHERDHLVKEALALV